jgi:hypothetical protein
MKKTSLRCGEVNQSINAVIASKASGAIFQAVIPGHAKREPGISRFSGVQGHTGVRC